MFDNGNLLQPAFLEGSGPDSSEKATTYFGTARSTQKQAVSTSGPPQCRLEVRTSSVQFKMVSMRSEEPIIMRSTPSLRSFPNVAFETVPVDRLTDDDHLSSFHGRSSSASSFHASLLQAMANVMS